MPWPRRTQTCAPRSAGSPRRFAPRRAPSPRDILPGVRETPATIKAALPWIAQTRKLLGADELGGAARQLRPSVAALSRVVAASRKLLPQIDLTAQCLSKVVLPTGDIKIQDGPLTTGAENYKEFWYAMVGLAGEGQNFDANGPYVRFQTGAGDRTITTGKVGGPKGEPFFGRGQTPLGTRPAYPVKPPPYVSSQRCKDQRIPDLNGARTGRPDGSSAPGPAASTPTSAPRLFPGAALRAGDAPGWSGDPLSRLAAFAAVAGP